MRQLVLVLLGALFLVACDEKQASNTDAPNTASNDVLVPTDAEGEPTADTGLDANLEDLTVESDMSVSPDLGPPQCPAASVEVIQFQTEDGVTLEADLHTTGVEGSPAVILLHMIPPSNDRTNYPAAFRELLNEQGFTVLNVDRRGAGGSSGVAKEAYEGPNGKLDAAAAVSALANLPCPPDLDRLGFVGASNGTTTALDYAMYAAASPKESSVPRALVFLTAGTYTENQTEFTAMLTTPEYEAMPILFVYPDNEAAWSEIYVGEPHFTHISYEASGHGTHLFDSAPEAMADVAEWLADTL